MRRIGPVIYVGFLLLPLFCWPGLERPFSTPKLWLLGGLDAAVAALYLLQRPGIAGGLSGADWSWLAWLAALSISALSAPYASFGALLLMLLPLPLFLALDRGLLSPDRVMRAILWSTAVLAAIASLQYCGLDPLRLTGWAPEAFSSPRMRVYGTLGNPAFVAAWICATLPLAIAKACRRRGWWALVGLQVLAIAATGSRVFLLALPAAAAVAFLRGARGSKWLLAGVPVAVALLWLSPARPLPETVEGRLYLARVAAAHWREVPVFGFGPGAFRPQFALWQVEWLNVHGPHSARFAGDVDHAHNDYLEIFVEYGPAGLAVFLGLCGWLVASAWRIPGAAACAVAALLAIACVDFPFHRPAEWALFWLLLGSMGLRVHQMQKKED
ncbi:MAG TPA: O-antigen ligase family protein [Bryobacteraceae bacterium]|nr:O-antigen ligase family protein [Bryobacteraceae bacterium]